ncbi:MAG: hypothetical protein MUP68_11085, partial [Deltaproteobacteria bacterium]|nr:hypothetical protein [Deltaproteobacteria bacterium]
MTNEEKKEIIELTEVVEESPSSAEPPPSFEDYEAEVRALREALNARAERWLTTEGVQVLNQGVREMIPRIAEEGMEKEIEKFKAEVEKIRTLQEALSAKVEQWLD